MKISKSNWYYISTIILMTLGALPFWIEYLTPKSKMLSYKIENSYRILSDSDLKDDIFKLTINDKTVNDARFTLIKIMNNGQIPIEKSDFTEPMNILVNENTNVLSAMIINTSPENMNVNVIINKSKIEVGQLLLNPTDNFTIRVVTSGIQPEIKLMARVKGIKSITKSDSEDKSINVTKFAFAIVGALLCGIVLMIIINSITDYRLGCPKPLNIYAYTLLFIVCSIPAIQIVDYLDNSLFSGSFIGFMSIWFFIIIIGNILEFLFGISFRKSFSSNNHVTLTPREKSSESHKDISSKDKILEEFNVPPPFPVDEYHINPLPREISDDIRNAKPFDREQRENSYIGLKVQWKGLFSSIREVKDENKYLVFMTFGITITEIVDFYIDKDNSHRLKQLNAETPFWVCGEIESIVCMNSVTLKDAQIKL